MSAAALAALGKWSAALRRRPRLATGWLVAVGGTRFKANVAEALASIREMGGRSVLALIGIAVGIAAVIAMVSTGEIVKEETLRQFRALGTDVLTLRRRFTDEGYTIAPADAAMLPAAVPSIAAVAPWTAETGAVRHRGRDVAVRGAMFGVTERFAALHRLTVAEGRFISDLDRGMSFCVIGHRVAQNIRADGTQQAIGEHVRFRDRLFTVVGVLGPGVGSVQSAPVDDAVLIPLSTARRLGREIDMAIMRLTAGADPFAAVGEVLAYFEQVSPGLDLDVTSARQLIEQMRRQAQMFTLLFTAVGSISLIVGGVGVMNVMLMSIAERRTEVGLRRAIGARRRDIMAQFLTESAVLCLFGGIAGIVLGTVAAWAISQYAGWSFFVSAIAAALGVGVSTAVGVFFGFYPARHAARLDPIVALQA